MSFFDPQQTSNKDETVKPFDQIDIKTGEAIIFGSHPENSKHFSPNYRMVQLNSNIEADQLSRAAVKVEVSQDGNLIITSLTAKNNVNFQYLANNHDGVWKNYIMTNNNPVPSQLINESKGGYAIGILTEDDTLIRL